MNNFSVKNIHTYILGISLMEMSIVISIIGIVITSISIGYNLIYTARMRNTISMLEIFKKATHNFITQYHYFPGDLPNASAIWGNYQSSPIIQGADNGNGNGNVESDSNIEDLYYWRHLSLSHNITGNYTGRPESTVPLSKYSSKVNAPESSAFKQVLFSFETQNTLPIWNTTGNVFKLASPSASSNNNLRQGNINVKDAYYIDKKIDDGHASHGNIYSTGNNSCVNGVLGIDKEVEYQLNNQQNDCILIYWYNKFNI